MVAGEVKLPDGRQTQGQTGFAFGCDDHDVVAAHLPSNWGWRLSMLVRMR